MNPTSRLSERCRDLLIETIATYIVIYCRFFSLPPVRAFWITGERNEVPAAEVTTTVFSFSGEARGNPSPSTRGYIKRTQPQY